MSNPSQQKKQPLKTDNRTASDRTARSTRQANEVPQKCYLSLVLIFFFGNKRENDHTRWPRSARLAETPYDSSKSKPEPLQCTTVKEKKTYQNLFNLPILRTNTQTTTTKSTTIGPDNNLQPKFISPRHEGKQFWKMSKTVLSIFTTDPSAET